MLKHKTMKLINKALLFLVLITGALYKAEEIPPAPTPPGGGGGTGPGVPASPIDMYIYALVLVAVFLIIYFVKKREKGLI